MIDTTTVQRSSPLQPGLWRSDPILERYVVPATGSATFEVHCGDQLTIIDPEGGQPCELIAFDSDGKPNPEGLSDRASVTASGFHQMISSGASGSERCLSGLAKRNIDVSQARALPLFGNHTQANEQAEFVAQSSLLCIVCAPGDAMAIDGQMPPTGLKAIIRRAQIVELTEPRLPDPLADPRLDFRIKKCTADQYTVRAGEFIQIIDVAGRECSDFLALSAPALDRGSERHIDMTTTRTLIGSAYPGPGLFSKYFDRDMNPLVEVVRDTCGRHDTFGLACAAKYYEDQGYFGHPNCSDNINAALAPNGIRPRKGWEAVNFFYNTGIDEHNVLFLDEPWSRPGDYVLLKALTDLVCVSTACPDDTSAANGWNPTDIHVRVYSAEKTFSTAIAYRMTPDAEPQLTRETGFHSQTSKHTRKFVDYRGYWLPTCFNNAGAVEEYWACREKAAVMDLSPLRKFEILGPDAETLMQTTLTRDVRRLSIGQVVYSAMCYPHGGMIDDGTALRLGPDNFRWIGGDDYSGIWLREQAAALKLNVLVKSSTDQIHNIAIQGPNSRKIIKEIFWTPPAQPDAEELKWFYFSVGRLGGPQGIPLMLSRTGYTGELGFELFCHPNDATAVWQAVWEAGQSYDLQPFGLDALDMVRIEAGLVFAGYEFDDQTDPYEAGIGFTVPLKSKQDDFIGRTALEKRKENPQRKLVGLEVSGNEIATHGDCVRVGRAQIGVITSATRSPVLRKNIALCRLDIEYAATGTEVEIGKLDGHQKRIPALVVPFPFYDPKKERVRA
jgi:aminomethyltransferase